MLISDWSSDVCSFARTRLVIVAFAASFAACASDYGGSISGKDVLSPQERRLQAVEGNVAVLQRRLDAVNLTGMDQQDRNLRDDVRCLRGDVEIGRAHV